MTKKRKTAIIFFTGLVALCFAITYVVWQTIDKMNEPEPTNLTQSVEGNAEAMLYPAWQQGEDNQIFWGYIDVQGNWVIEQLYDKALPMNTKGLCWVLENEKWGAINETGKTVVPFSLENIYMQANEYVIAKEGDSHYVYDAAGQKIFGVAGDIQPFNEGMAAFGRQKDSSQLYGFIDSLGQIIVEPIYEAVGNFYDGQALVRTTEGKVFLIDKGGKTLVEMPSSVLLGSLNEGRIIYQSDTGTMGYLDTQGNVVIKAYYLQAHPFYNGAALVLTTKGYGLLATDGSWLVQPSFGYGAYLGRNLYAFAKSKASPRALFNNEGVQLSEFCYNVLGQEDPMLYVGSLAQSWHFNIKTPFVLAQTDSESCFLNDEGQEITSLPSLSGSYVLYVLGDLIMVNDQASFYYINAEDEQIYGSNYGITLNDKAFAEANYANSIYDLQVVYPQISGLSGKLSQQKINSQIYYLCVSPWVNQAKGGYLVQLSADWKMVGDVLELYQIGRVISPEGETEKVELYYHIDINTGRSYKLWDLYENGAGWRNSIEKTIEKVVAALPGASYPETWVDAGLINNQTEFKLSTDGMNILVDPESQEIERFVVVPWSFLMEDIYKNGTFWQAITAE